MAWHAALSLRYRRDGERTVAHDRHEGPLRVLAALYPEGPAVCQHVIVHPPAGIVGGDTLDVRLELGEGAHALLTTPGATRFYRSSGADAVQNIHATLAPGARLEWLPLETIAHPGCIARNRTHMALAPGAEAIGWEVLALGLPASGQPFDAGRFTASIEVDGAWIERGCIDAADTRLLHSPLGLDGASVVATVWFAAGEAIGGSRGEALIEAARAAADGLEAGARSGVTALHPRVIVLRALATQVEPAARLLRTVRAAWRRVAWGLDGATPRVWGSGLEK